MATREPRWPPYGFPDDSHCCQHYCGRQGLCSDIMIDTYLETRVERAVESALQKYFDKEKEDAE